MTNRRGNQRIEDLYLSDMLRHPLNRKAAEWNESRIARQERDRPKTGSRWMYRLGWAAFFLVGNYLYFTSAPRKGAADLFLSDPLAAFVKYYVGNPLESFAAIIMWAAAYQAGLVIVAPEERISHTILSLILIAVSLGLYSRI